MKKLVLFFLLIACFAAKGQEVRLRGHLPEGLKEKSLRLSHINGFESTIPVADDRSFDVHVVIPQTGIYNIKEIGEVYLKPDFDLILIPGSAASYRFQGMGSTENNLITETKNSLGTYLPTNGRYLSFTAFAMDVPVFTERLEQYQQNAEAMLANSTDLYFIRNWQGEISYFVKELMQRYHANYGIDSAKHQAYFSLRNTTDQSDSVAVKKLRDAEKAFSFRQLTPQERETIQSWLRRDTTDIHNGELFENSPAYRSALDVWLAGRMFRDHHDRLVRGESHRLIRMEVVNQYIEEPRIHEYFLYTSGMSFIQIHTDDTDALTEVYGALMTSINNERYRSTIQQTFHNWEALQTGSLAPEFAYESIDGKTVKLSDLRGSYVFIDVWATWCAPCIAQIPHIVQLEKDYHGKNLIFVGISVDRVSDKDKWRAFVVENELTGIQLFADNATQSDFVKRLNINSIPRFILIDPAGKIVSANADWPSRPGIRTLLDQLLVSGE